MTGKKLIPFLFLGLLLFFASYSFAAEVHFQWGSSSGVVEGYRIYYGFTHQGPYPNLLVEVGSRSTTIDCTATLDEGVTYYLVVRAYNSYGESGNSNEVKWPSGPLPPPDNVPPTINSFTCTPSTLNNPGESTTFNVSATDPDGDSLTYTINFGDGTANGSGSQVVHTYETQGTYTAEVSVDDGNGHTVAESLQVTVNDIPPTKPTNVTAN